LIEKVDADDTVMRPFPIEENIFATTGTLGKACAAIATDVNVAVDMSKQALLEHCILTPLRLMMRFD
jgi:hypothetical protein